MSRKKIKVRQARIMMIRMTERTRRTSIALMESCTCRHCSTRFRVSARASRAAKTH